MTLHSHVLSDAQQRVLRQLGPVLEPRGMVLGGGTAVAIHLGHRRSVDLDWLTEQRLADPMRLAQDLRDAAIAFETGSVDRGTLHGSVLGVRVSFLEYRYPLLKPAIAWPTFECSIASLDDLACMKLLAVAQRGLRKDFVDVYALGLEHVALEDMLERYCRKFSVSDTARVLYSLTYFDDAERQPMPEMIWDTDWDTITKTVQDWIKALAG